jgi:hypothetical protein
MWGQAVCERWGKGDVGQRMQLGRKRSWVGGWLTGRGERRKKGGRGPRAGWEREKEFGVCFFLFFQILFKQLFKTFFKSNLLHKFLQTFHKPFSQIILKTFKATQQQNSFIST